MGFSSHVTVRGNMRLTGALVQLGGCSSEDDEEICAGEVGDESSGWIHVLPPNLLYVPVVTYSHELCVMHEIRFLCRVTGLTFCDVRRFGGTSNESRSFKRSWLKWFGRLVRMPLVRPMGAVLGMSHWAEPRRKNPAVLEGSYLLFGLGMSGNPPE